MELKIESYTIFPAFLIVIVVIVFMISWYLTMNTIRPDTTVPGCAGAYCVATDAVGHDSKGGNCSGAYCKAGDCMGEFCQAGSCIGDSCRGGDCYGYGCKPGSCTDPNCINDKKGCPDKFKKCYPGIANKITNFRHQKVKNIFPKSTMLNPPLCRGNLTVDDLKKGRVDMLGITHFSTQDSSKTSGKSYTIDEIYDMDENIKITNTYPYTVKNINCDLCLTDQPICRDYTPIKTDDGHTETVEWVPV